MEQVQKKKKVPARRKEGERNLHGRAARFESWRKWVDALPYYVAVLNGQSRRQTERRGGCRRQHSRRLAEAVIDKEAAQERLLTASRHSVFSRSRQETTTTTTTTKNNNTGYSSRNSKEFVAPVVHAFLLTPALTFFYHFPFNRVEQEIHCIASGLPFQSGECTAMTHYWTK